MSQLRFNHVFLALMGIALACAYIIPPSITDRAKGKEEMLLYPVARPVRLVASWFQSKYGKPEAIPGDFMRTDEELRRENVRLQVQLQFLTSQLKELRHINEEREKLGPLLNDFQPVTVIGGDTTGRDSLSIVPSAGASFTLDTPVLNADGAIIGKLVEGRRVRLLTDRGFKLAAEFWRIEQESHTQILDKRASVEGIGQGTMRVDMLTTEDASKLRPGDWVILSDDTWPRLVKGKLIGIVESVRPQPRQPMFAEIIIKPRGDLKKLKEVLVLKK